MKDQEKLDNGVQGAGAANNDGGTDNVDKGESRGAFWAPLHSVNDMHVMIM